MFDLDWTREAVKQYDALKAAAQKQKTGRQAAIYKQVHKALFLLRENPKHPSLRTHKYSSISDPSEQEVFEAYAQNNTPGADRIFWQYGATRNRITIIAITPHP